MTFSKGNKYDFLALLNSSDEDGVAWTHHASVDIQSFIPIVLSFIDGN